MTPGAAIFLTLLPLAGVPVVFHFLLRRKRRKYVFSTPMFLHKVDPKMRSRRRLQEILLLISRVLLIALVLLALSRLSVNTVGDVFGLGQRQMIVILVDNSGSMSTKMPDGGSTKLQTAKDSAQVLLSQLDDDAKAAVLTLVEDPGVTASTDMKGDKASLSDKIGRIAPTEATGSPAESLLRALSLLKNASATGAGCVHIFTDLQDTEWGAGDIGKLTDAPNVQVFFHRVPSAPIESNISLASTQLSGRRVLPKQPHSVLVELRNDGKEPVAVRLNSRDDQRKQSTSTVFVPAGARKVARVMIQPESTGTHWVRIWIEGDGFAGDNQAVVAYRCEPMARVFLVGNESEFGRLPLAISPYGDGRYTSLVPEVVRLEGLPARIEKTPPVLLVMSWTRAAQIASEPAGKWLEEHVTGGGNLLLVPPAQGAMGPVQIPVWMDVAVAARVKPAQQARLDVLSRDNAFWDDLRTPGGTVQLVGAFARQYHPVLLPKDGRTVPLLGVRGKGAVLALATRGRGRVICSGMAFAQPWSLLPKMQEFVVMTQAMALGTGRDESAGSISMVAGQPPESLPGTESDIRIISLVGDPMDWSGSRDQFPKFVRSGGYEMRIGDARYGVSVRGSTREGSQKFLSGDSVPAMGRIEHTVTELDDAGELKDLLTASRTGIDLYLPLLLAAMVALMAESILGSPRKHSSPKSVSKTGGAKP